MEALRRHSAFPLRIVEDFSRSLRAFVVSTRPRDEYASVDIGSYHFAGSVAPPLRGGDRKSTRLNSSHSQISYAVFCLKKKCIFQTSNLSCTTSATIPGILA